MKYCQLWTTISLFFHFWISLPPSSLLIIPFFYFVRKPLLVLPVLCSHGLSLTFPKCFSLRNPVHSLPSLVRCSPGLRPRSHRPIFTIVNTQSLSLIAFFFFFFFDDNQLYITGLFSELSYLVSTQSCISRLKFWMSVDELKLNEYKSEMILISPPKSTLSLPSSVDLNGCSITISFSVRNLGVTIDQSLSFRKHVANVCVCASWGFTTFPLFVTFLLIMPLKPFSVLFFWGGGGLFVCLGGGGWLICWLVG